MGYIQSSHSITAVWSFGLVDPESGTKTNASQPSHVSAMRPVGVRMYLRPATLSFLFISSSKGAVFFRSSPTLAIWNLIVFVISQANRSGDQSLQDESDPRLTHFGH